MVNLPARIRWRGTSPNQRTPILVTGAHRSGTTWVGRILATAPSVFYLQEPFNFSGPNALTTIRENLWYPYVTEKNGHKYEEGFRDAFRLKLRCFSDARLLWRKPLALTRRIVLAARLGLLRLRADYRVLVKDPLALLAAPWLAHNFGASPIILIRHPAAFVSSLKVKQWYPPFDSFLAQPDLIEEHFPDSAQAIAQIANDNTRDIVMQGALFWKLIYRVVTEYKQRFAGWCFVRHEDLSRQPQLSFQQLFKHLHLPYTRGTEDRIRATTQRRDREYVFNSTDPADVVRNSLENIYVWKQRLTASEIARVRQIVGEVSQSFYSDADW